MKLSEPLRHVARSGAASVATAAFLVGLAWYLRRPVHGWSLFGWVLATALGLFFGARLVALHGTPGTAFLKALGSCILARLFTFAGGTAWAVSHSMEEALAFLVGVVAGYLPTQIVEMVWFASQTKDQPS